MAVDIGKKIEAIIEWTGLSVNQFAVKFHEKPDKYYNVIKGKNYPSWDMLRNIIEAYPQIDGNWLLKDQGTMFGDVTPDQIDQPVSQEPSQALLLKEVSIEPQAVKQDVEARLLNRIIGDKEKIIFLLEKQIALLEKRGQ